MAALGAVFSVLWGPTIAPLSLRPRRAHGNSTPLRLVVTRSLQLDGAELNLHAELDAVKRELQSLRTTADRAVLHAVEKLEHREALARKAYEADAKKAVERVRKESEEQRRRLDDKLVSLAKTSDQTLRDLRRSVDADAKSTLHHATSKATSGAAAANARSSALHQQLQLLTSVAERLTSMLAAKAEADNQLAHLSTAFAELTHESAVLKDALAAAEARAAAAEARSAAAERSVAERVKETLASASAIVEAAEAVRAETEQRAAAQAQVHEHMLTAAMARADAAEAELARRPLLLDTLGQKSAELEQTRGELSMATLQIEALQAECNALRLARQQAQEEAAQAGARAEVLQSGAHAETQRLIAAVQERMETELHIERVRAERLEAQLSACTAERDAAQAVALDAEHRLRVMLAAVDREREAHLNALATLERSREEWKARAAQYEEAEQKGSALPSLAGGRLRACMSDVQLRALMARGPRIEDRQRWEGELRREGANCADDGMNAQRAQAMA